MRLEENCAALPQRRKYSKSSAEKIEPGEEIDGRSKAKLCPYSCIINNSQEKSVMQLVIRDFRSLGVKLGAFKVFAITRMFMINKNLLL